MIRTLIEALLMIAVILVARAVLTSIFRGIGRASANSFGTQSTEKPHQNPAPSPSVGGDLHKDPVCGTYVAVSTAFHRQAGSQTFYYCSDTCREKHALAAR